MGAGQSIRLPLIIRPFMFLRKQALGVCIFLQFFPTGKRFAEKLLGAATIPLAAMTAAISLYQRLNLPLPWNPTSEPLSLVIYGGVTAVGAFIIKFARLSNIHPLIVVVCRGSAFVETIIDPKKGNTIIDYYEGD